MHVSAFHVVAFIFEREIWIRLPFGVWGHYVGFVPISAVRRSLRTAAGLLTKSFILFTYQLIYCVFMTWLARLFVNSFSRPKKGHRKTRVSRPAGNRLLTACQPPCIPTLPQLTMRSVLFVPFPSSFYSHSRTHFCFFTPSHSYFLFHMFY